MALKKIVCLKWIISFSAVYGAVQLTCDPQRPLEGSDVNCKCSSSNNIRWIVDGSTKLDCITSGVCIPDTPPDGYSVSFNDGGTIKEYGLDILNYTYANCAKYECKDVATNDVEEADLSISDFNGNVPAAIDEPADKEGNISITTDCLFRESDIVVNWYTVQGDEQMSYEPEKNFSESTACSYSCSGEAAVTLKIGFSHSEETSILKQKVKFRIEVYHSTDMNIKLNLTTAKDYYIKGSTTPSPTSTISAANTTGSSTSLPNVTDSDDKKTIIGVSVGVVIAVVLAISIGVCCFCKYKNRQTKTERSKGSYVAENRL